MNKSGIVMMVSQTFLCYVHENAQKHKICLILTQLPFLFWIGDKQNIGQKVLACFAC